VGFSVSADAFYDAQLWLILDQIVSAMVGCIGVICRPASTNGFAFGSESLSGCRDWLSSWKVGVGSFDPNR
jgi:hypothetical protein